VSGSVTFSPAGIAPRAVKLWVGAGGGGPIVFYWHGTGSSPDEAAYGLGPAAIAAITASGGVVAAPTHDANAGQWPWYLVSGTQLDDLLLADEVLACAVEKKQIDTLRIHVAGMSAGGLMTAQMSLRRSSYVASAAPYSGGIIAGLNPPNENPANKLSALIFWGGTSDVVVISFQDASMAYSDLLRHNGSSTILCNHGGGHTIPQTGVPAVWRFFQDHPFGTSPSPYVAAGLPSVFPSYCTL
jgi:poly(3-hydroxybutyrate) depolymerase